MLPSSSMQKRIQPQHCHAAAREQKAIERHDLDQEPFERHEINFANRDRCGVLIHPRHFDMLEHFYK